MNIFTEANDLESLYKRKKQIREELDSVYLQGRNLQANFVELSHMFPQRSQPYHITEQQDKLRGQINELNVAFSEYKKKKELIEGEITGRESCLGSSVTVYLEAVADGEATLSLTYLVNNVSFKPNYDIHASLSEREGGPKINILRVIYQASLEQSTGEDWKNVILKASTFYLTGNVITSGDQVAPTSYGDSTFYSRQREVVTQLGQYTIGRKTTTQGTQNIFIANLNFTEVDIDYGLRRIYQAYITNTSSHFLLEGSVNFMLNGRLVGMTTIPVSSYYSLNNE